jgi:hypothetical protein
MGIQAVKHGLTDPREIRRLLQRGVRVFTRSNLHAKFFICGRALLVGSTNISRNSQCVLEEAASLTTDGSALRRAIDFFHALCTEPVRPEYLKICLKNYKPPLIPTETVLQRSNQGHRQKEAKLWFIGGLRYSRVPAEENEKAKKIETAAAKRLRSARTSVDYNHYPSKPRYFSNIRVGDWVVDSILESDGTRFVHAPEQVLGQESYSRGRRKRRYLLLIEEHNDSEKMAFRKFRERVKRIVPKLDTNRPRTMPIEDMAAADQILALWTPTGRVSKSRYKRRAIEKHR